MREHWRKSDAAWAYWIGYLPMSGRRLCLNPLKSTIRMKGRNTLTECTKFAHRHSLAIFTADSGVAEIPAMGIIFQRTSPFASDFGSLGNRASWGLKGRAILWGSGENRRCNRRESRDFGALSTWIVMDFCGLPQGMSSDIAWIFQIPYAMHLPEKSPPWRRFQH